MQSLQVHSMVWPMDLDEGTPTLWVGGAEITERQLQEEMEAILMAVMARMEERERGKMDASDAEEGTDYVAEQRDEVDGRDVTTATEQRNCSPMHGCQPVTTGGCTGDLNGLQETEAGLPLSVGPLGVWVTGEIDTCTFIIHYSRDPLHFVRPKRDFLDVLLNSNCAC